MQHHDGITATAKHKIEQDMLSRLRDGNEVIINEFKQLYNISELKYCNLIEGNN